PVPVAALGDEQLFVSQAPLLLGDAGDLIVGLARAQQILPGFVVLLRADPDIEIGAYPGTRKNVIDRLGRNEIESFADCERLRVRLVLNPPVQLAKKGPPAAVIILPGVLSIENDGDQRVASTGQNAGTVLADTDQEVVGGLRGVHTGVHEADEVAKEMIAENDVQGAIALLPQVGPVQIEDPGRMT